MDFSHKNNIVVIFIVLVTCFLIKWKKDPKQALQERLSEVMEKLHSMQNLINVDCFIALGFSKCKYK